MASPPSDPELLFGKLVLHYKLAGKEAVQEALRERQREGGLRGLAEILVERGTITQGHADKLRQVQREMAARDQRAEAGSAPAQAGAPAAGQAASPGSQGAPTPPADAPRPQVPPAAREVPPPAGPTPDPTPSPPAATEPSFERGIDRLLHRAVSQGASDVHIHSGAPPIARLDGELTPLEDGVLSPQEAEHLLQHVLSDEQRQVLETSGQVDFAYQLAGVGRFRANAYRQQRGLDAVFRSIPDEPPTLEALGLPETLGRLTEFHQGMVLVTGPSGCGKSTTLAALVEKANRERPDHVITVEDPIEVVYSSKRCLVNQRQVGRHTEGFPRALRAALREDPDVIVIGELRDLETISLALTAAETGHLVLATLHTANAIRTINRMIGVFPSDQQAQIRTMVSESLRAVISQRLVSRADGQGRVAALEILVGTPAVANLIRESKTFQIRSILQTGAAHGMTSLDASLARLVASGTIAKSEARRHAEEPEQFADRRPAAADVAGNPGAASTHGSATR